MKMRRLKYPNISSCKKSWNWVRSELTVMYAVLSQFRNKANELRVNKDKYTRNDYMDEYCDAMNSTIGNFMSHSAFNFEECHELYKSFKMRRVYYECRARNLKMKYHKWCRYTDGSSDKETSQKPCEP